ncbi:hypothetical protein WICPIJ_009145 [Wickerhamomyces pijperi]|uniref:Uncharacterized protein n=1 Tax=Wickerhamomyces pijperi TaxID=599730 RepID=A0A9P8PRN9_WICPI|nr:hypothetical protein WICPIJ_009145 [Wickerhamomyces pijperi]
MSPDDSQVLLVDPTIGGDRGRVQSVDGQLLEKALTAADELLLFELAVLELPLNALDTTGTAGVEENKSSRRSLLFCLTGAWLSSLMRSSKSSVLLILRCEWALFPLAFGLIKVIESEVDTTGGGILAKILDLTELDSLRRLKAAWVLDDDDLVESFKHAVKRYELRPFSCNNRRSFKYETMESSVIVTPCSSIFWLNSNSPNSPSNFKSTYLVDSLSGLFKIKERILAGLEMALPPMLTSLINVSYFQFWLGSSSSLLRMLVTFWMMYACKSFSLEFSKNLNISFTKIRMLVVSRMAKANSKALLLMDRSMSPKQRMMSCWCLCTANGSSSTTLSNKFKAMYLLLLLSLTESNWPKVLIPRILRDWSSQHVVHAVSDRLADVQRVVGEEQAQGLDGGVLEERVVDTNGVVFRNIGVEHKVLQNLNDLWEILDQFLVVFAIVTKHSHHLQGTQEDTMVCVIQQVVEVANEHVAQVWVLLKDLCSDNGGFLHQIAVVSP